MYQNEIQMHWGKCKCTEEKCKNTKLFGKKSITFRDFRIFVILKHGNNFNVSLCWNKLRNDSLLFRVSAVSPLYSPLVNWVRSEKRPYDL